MVVCTANTGHIEGAKRLVDANREIFSFITQAAFRDAWFERSLLVALVDGRVAGFVRYHHRQRDARTTLYDICVDDPLRGQGIGSKMIDQLKEECRARERSMIGLKCPAGLRANAFYAEQGFSLVATLPGKRQPINVWRFVLASETEA